MPTRPEHGAQVWEGEDGASMGRREEAHHCAKTISIGLGQRCLRGTRHEQLIVRTQKRCHWQPERPGRTTIESKRGFEGSHLRRRRCGNFGVSRGAGWPAALCPRMWYPADGPSLGAPLPWGARGCIACRPVLLGWFDSDPARLVGTPLSDYMSRK